MPFRKPGYPPPSMAIHVGLYLWSLVIIKSNFKECILKIISGNDVNCFVHLFLLFICILFLLFLQFCFSFSFISFTIIILKNIFCQCAGKPWFHEQLTRLEAEDMLKRVRMDGAFLIRPSEHKQSGKAFSISFRWVGGWVGVSSSSTTHMFISFPWQHHRAEGKVRHCRIHVENNQYMIGSAMFECLTELVQYYESNPLYRRMKLKYAINEEVLKSIGEVSSPEGMQ